MTFAPRSARLVRGTFDSQVNRSPSPLASIVTLLVLALSIAQGLQLLRGLLASLSVYLGQIRDIESGSLAGVILLIFLSAVAAPLVRRFIGGGQSLLILAATLALLRLAEQLAPTPDARLGVEIAGVVVWLWMLQFVASISPLSSARSGVGRPVVVLLLGLTIDTAINGAFETLDPSFSTALGPLLFTILSISAQLAMISWVGRCHAAPVTIASPPSLAFCIGPALALEALLFQSLARQVVLIGWELPETFAWLMAANLLAIWIAAFCSVRGSSPPWWASIAAAAALLVSVIHPEHHAWAAIVAAGGPIAIGVLLTAALTAKHAGGRGWISAASGMLAIPLVIFGWYAHYQLDVPLPQFVFVVFAATLVALAGCVGSVRLWTSHPRAAERAPAIRLSWQRAALVPAIASVLMLLPLYHVVTWRTPDQPPAADVPVRLATYNIHQGFDLQGMPSLERILAVLEQERPHVVALQEVPRGWVVNGSVDALSWLAQRLRMHSAWGPAADPFWGSAVLSRYPIVHMEHHPMPNNDDLNLDRGYLLVTVNLHGELVQLVATHLHHIESEPHHRIPQVTELVDAVDWSRPSVLLGDLNAQPHHAEIRMLAEAGLMPRQPAVPTYPADQPRRQIDYIMTTDALTIVELRSAPTDASDHLPLFATLVR
ncbi:MAG: endonuclease/exonuclease/phosphatase family protein [Chloroflexota bacterium]|nr:endonuclease/exonuclease/phosphatase family protein [Chloroflexota bacterium]